MIEPSEVEEEGVEARGNVSVVGEVWEESSKNLLEGGELGDQARGNVSEEG